MHAGLPATPKTIVRKFRVLLAEILLGYRYKKNFDCPFWQLIEDIENRKFRNEFLATSGDFFSIPAS
jgi:hypothetical protein